MRLQKKYKDKDNDNTWAQIFFSFSYLQRCERKCFQRDVNLRSFWTDNLELHSLSAFCVAKENIFHLFFPLQQNRKGSCFSFPCPVSIREAVSCLLHGQLHMDFIEPWQKGLFSLVARILLILEFKSQVSRAYFPVCSLIRLPHDGYLLHECLQVTCS